MSDYSDLIELYRKRLQDRKQAKTRRRRRLEADPKPLDSIMQTFFKDNPVARMRMDESRAIEAWPRFVGETAAKVSRVTRVRKDQLIVQVNDPVWMHQLFLLKHELIKKYREAFPSLKLRDIYYYHRN